MSEEKNHPQCESIAVNYGQQCQLISGHFGDHKAGATTWHKDVLIPISEIFGPVIQGEGSMAGKPTVFVRVGGCDYHCSWCDTLYAVEKAKYGHTWTKMTSEAILDEIVRLSKGQKILVTLSGGNPALFALGSLIEQGQALGYTFACETQGSVCQPWFGQLDNLTLSPKPPSSGEKTDWNKLNKSLMTGYFKKNDNEEFETTGCQVIFKVVVSDETDYKYAKEVHAFHPTIPFYISVCSPTDGSIPYIRAEIAKKYTEILSWLVRDQWYDCNLGFQQHSMIFGNARGV